jgi:hypothetical protein
MACPAGHAKYIQRRENMRVLIKKTGGEIGVSPQGLDVRDVRILKDYSCHNRGVDVI